VRSNLSLGAKAVASASGKQLLSLGDGDVRLWSVENKQLKLIAKHFLNGRTEIQAFATVALKSGDFVFWDGAHLWRYPGDGGTPTLYAGSKLK